MTLVRFVSADGGKVREVQAAAGERLLDLALHVTRHSRLACQIWLTEELAGLTVRMPGGAHNMQGR